MQTTIDFNCTIQELKLTSGVDMDRDKQYFNCTIQELKLIDSLLISLKGFQFQLHHTGIKTRRTTSESGRPCHHFNCTIQELKRSGGCSAIFSWRFQLHHTGIKTNQLRQISKFLSGFQLHHTGIKTCRFHLDLLLQLLFQLHHTGIKTDDAVVQSSLIS